VKTTTLRIALAGPVVLLLLLGLPRAAESQLLSPGRLSAPHAELEGIRNCTSCHALGQRGIAPDRCLECHEPLASRIEAGLGYHAAAAAEACADCHQEHLGTDFDMRHLDEDAFEHTETGYELELSHDSVDCADCHQPSHIVDPAILSYTDERGTRERTFLGLSTDCAGCHEDESPHGNQFAARGCADCHDTGVWETPPNFDHAQTAFPLAGLHVDAACVECHGSGSDAVYRPLAFGRCNDCHEDPHSGGMSGPCASCHRTAGWTIISSANMETSFNHSATSFPLVGAHAAVECTTCHQPGRPLRTDAISMRYLSGTQRSTYPRPVFDTCRACHVDRHDTPAGGQRWADCEACHSNDRWNPSPYDIARHEQSDFPLTGAHTVTPCVSCHQDAERGHAIFTLALPERTCEECHGADDPHEGLYAGLACAECHDTEAFETATFEHALVTGVPEPAACASCHATDDPHVDQFEGRDCAECHATEAFTIEQFDHATTDFPLDGAHDDAPCASCHLAEPGPPDFVRYHPLGTECADCHAEAA
jgi:hypothetical protein